MARRDSCVVRLDVVCGNSIVASSAQHSHWQLTSLRKKTPLHSCTTRLLPGGERQAPVCDVTLSQRTSFFLHSAGQDQAEIMHNAVYQVSRVSKHKFRAENSNLRVHRSFPGMVWTFGGQVDVAPAGRWRATPNERGGFYPASSHCAAGAAE